MKLFPMVLPHIQIILSITFVVLWILDYFNPMMHFLTAPLPKALLLLLLICGILHGMYHIYEQRNQR